MWRDRLINCPVGRMCIPVINHSSALQVVRRNLQNCILRSAAPCISSSLGAGTRQSIKAGAAVCFRESSCQTSLTALTPEAQGSVRRSFRTVTESSILQICFPSRYFMKMDCQSSWWDRSVCLHLSVAVLWSTTSTCWTRLQAERGKGAVPFTAKSLKQLLVLSLCLSRFFFPFAFLLAPPATFKLFRLHFISQFFGFFFPPPPFLFFSPKGRARGRHEHMWGVVLFIDWFWELKMPAKREGGGLAAPGGSQCSEADWKHHTWQCTKKDSHTAKFLLVQKT